MWPAAEFSHVSMISNDAVFLVIAFRNPAYSHEFHSGRINRRRQTRCEREGRKGRQQ